MGVGCEGHGRGGAFVCVWVVLEKEAEGGVRDGFYGVACWDGVFVAYGDVVGGDQVLDLGKRGWGGIARSVRRPRGWLWLLKLRLCGG